MIGIYKTNFPQNLLKTDRQNSSVDKASSNNSLFNIKLSKTQLSKIIWSGGFLGRLLESLMKVGLLLMKNVLMSLVKSLLIPLGLTAAPSTADGGIYRKTLGLPTSGLVTTTLTIPNKEINFAIKIVKLFQDSRLLIKGLTEQMKMKQKKT